ncbi:hypothetical protein ONE63_004036 [Megalurothrips usitatus]|uniref:Ciliary microtubule inner protein 2A-C-like domain-containing protein n=1 Tax=Megalurothrips usitatus TaxID=439358 RepID=A0AAV7X4W7_9NEOP|nr:hypothetical protein ONE63_004036 [Megalurothrips usitatus]
MSVALFETPQPLMVPGYTGYVPQYRYRIGETFGKTTHKIMLDPHIQLAERLVLSDRSSDNYQVARPTENDVDIVQSRFRYGDPLYQHPVIPGYEGFLPRLRGQFGQRYTASAAAALSGFELQQRREREARQQLWRTQQLQDNAAEPRHLLDRMVQANQWKMPLYMVRPEMTGVIRHVCAPEAAVPPARNALSPYFADPNDPDKYFVLGYTGHVPFGMARYGQSSQALTRSALSDFTHHYRRRQSTEWAPVGVVQPDPPLLLSPAEIYHKHVGLLPRYNGHLPGAKFRYGNTYGNDSRDGKRWLRGDFTT